MGSHSQIWQRALTTKKLQKREDLGFLSLEIECVWTEDRGEPSIDRSEGLYTMGQIGFGNVKKRGTPKLDEIYSLRMALICSSRLTDGNRDISDEGGQFARCHLGDEDVGHLRIEKNSAYGWHGPG